MVTITLEKDAIKTIKNVTKIKGRSKTSVPILNYLKVEVVNETTLNVYFTNIEVYIVKEIKASIKTGNKSEFLLPVSLFKNAKVSFPITIEIPDTELINVVQNGVSQTIPTHDPKEYPKLPNLKNLKTVYALRNDTLEKIKAAALSVFKSTTRPILQTVCLRDNKILSTDTHRLYISSVKGNVGLEIDINLRQELIQAINLIEGKNFFGVIRSDEQENLVIETMDTLYYSNSLEGTYPDVSSLVSENGFRNEFTVENVSLLKHVVTACRDIVKDTENQPMKLKIIDENYIELSTKTTDKGQVCEQIPIKAKHVHKDFAIQFNSSYLLDAIKQQGKTKRIDFYLRESMRPFTLKGEDESTFSLILPIKPF